MRKFFAVLVLLCFGMVVPGAALPIRVCLLDQKERKEECCKKCDPEGKTPCCTLKEKVPDSSAPGGALGIPPFIAFEIPVPDIGALPEAPVPPLAWRFNRPIRGPDSPAAFRAILSVWRL